MGRKGEKIAKGKKCWSVSETFFLLIKPLREIFFFNHLTGREKLRKTLNGVEVKRILHLGCKCFCAMCVFFAKGRFCVAFICTNEGLPGTGKWIYLLYNCFQHTKRVQHSGKNYQNGKDSPGI